MKLILTEKPNVSKQVKQALAPDAHYVTTSKATGKLPPVGYYESPRFLICNSVGHIVNIKAPRDIDADRFGWKLDCLPYSFPHPLPLEVTKENTHIFGAIKDCFMNHDYDEIIIATDGDREGQNIWRKIELMLPKKKNVPISRMWLSEWTPDGIRKAYADRFDNSLKDGLASAARCREDADYIIGMNCTAALTCKYSKGFGNVLSIGRVMGPTMKIVVDREKEITGFKPKPYTAITLETSSDEAGKKLALKAKKTQYTDAEAKDVLAKMPPEVILDKTVKTVRKRCPELYDATSIAQDMNKRYGFSAKKTADIIQKLYQDYTLTTYPGTNSTKMSEGSAKMAGRALDNLAGRLGIRQAEVEELKKNGWKPANHVVTSEGLAHEAITPVYGTSSKDSLAKLDKDSRKVYDAIVDRFLQVFYPQAVFEEAVISCDAAGEKFETKGRMVKDAGWMKISGPGKDTLLPKVTGGKSYHAKAKTEEKQTTPPARYTEDTLLQAMKNAGRFVDDEKETAILKECEGLGPGRTRPAIIENIKHREYFEIQKKAIHPTKKCMDLFEVLPNSTLTSPSLTARFESMIQAVEDGEMTYDDYMDVISKDVQNVIEGIKNDGSGKTVGRKKMEGERKCPICGDELRENDKSWYCAGWKDGCKFSVWKTIAGKKLTDKQIAMLLDEGHTGIIKGFKSRAGKSFDAVLKLVDGKVEFDFDAGKSSEDWGICPICGGQMQETSKGVGCSNWKDGCKYTVWKVQAGKKLTNAQIHEIIKNKGTLKPIKGFKSKAGKPFDANIVWNGDENRFTFRFD